MIALDVSLHRVRWSGLAVRFDSCPPRFALVLDLRKSHNQPALDGMVSQALSETSFLVTGMACLPQRSQGRGRRTGDIKVGRHAVAVAGLETHGLASYQTKIDGK